MLCEERSKDTWQTREKQLGIRDDISGRKVGHWAWRTKLRDLDLLKWAAENPCTI